MAGARAMVLARYRELLQLISRLPDQKRQEALLEARKTMRDRRVESDPQKQLDYVRELVSRVGYLRIVTPRQPGEVGKEAGVYVIRNGQVVEGSGTLKGARVADGTITMDEAVKRNARDFKRFYGADKPKGILF